MELKDWPIWVRIVSNPVWSLPKSRSIRWTGNIKIADRTKKFHAHRCRLRRCHRRPDQRDYLFRKEISRCGSPCLRMHVQEGKCEDRGGGVWQYPIESAWIRTEYCEFRTNPDTRWSVAWAFSCFWLFIDCSTNVPTLFDEKIINKDTRVDHNKKRWDGIKWGVPSAVKRRTRAFDYDCDAPRASASHTLLGVPRRRLPSKN